MMIETSPPIGHPTNHHPLRSINDFSNDEEVEEALRDSIHCIHPALFSKPHQSSLVDWCLPSCSTTPTLTRQVVARELRRLKSLKSFQILDARVAPLRPSRRSSFTVGSSSDVCFKDPAIAPGKNPLKSAAAAAVAASAAVPPAAAPSSSTTSDPSADPSSSLEALDRLVDMATRMFDVSIAIVSVTDMERQKILAVKGLEVDVQELPREATIGAQVVIRQEDIIVVPDLTKDSRFQHLNPCEDGRFYCGAPLVTPEGERIGAFCLLDTKPRPEGLSEQEQQDLHNFAGLAMHTLVERRSRLKLSRKLKTANRAVSATVHDLLTPLTAIELAVSLLHEDQDFQSKLAQHQKESVKIASNCIGVLGQMIRSIRDQQSATCRRGGQVKTQVAGSVVPIASTTAPLSHADFGLTADSFSIMYGSGKAGKDAAEDKKSESAADRSGLVTSSSFSSLGEAKVLAVPKSTVAVQDLIKSIHMAADAIPKTVPLTISLHASVPSRIVTDDLKVLRCALNLLEHTASIALSGSIHFGIMAQYCRCGKAMLGFHCENQTEGGEDSSDPSSAGRQCIMQCCSSAQKKRSQNLLDLSMSSASTSSSESSCSSCSSQSKGGCCHVRNAAERQCLRNCSELNLYNVAMQMDAMGGDCGIGDPATSSDRVEDSTLKGTSFWFRIPLEEASTPRDVQEHLTGGTKKPEKSVSFLADPTTSTPSVEGKVAEEKSNDSAKRADATIVLESKPRKRRALIIEDSIVIRKVIANALSKIGFEVETAVNGMEGLHHLQGSIYDVVLCDFLMPVMDGLDCVQQYRDWEKIHRPLLRQYIIGMSAHASDQDVDHGLRAGMDCYKPKPLTYKGLKNIVDACERNQQQNSISTNAQPVESGPAAVHVLSRQAQTLPGYDRHQPKMCLIATKDNDSYDLVRLTEARGWKSLIVHDGEDALQALKKRNWDAVLLDEKLPLLTGRNCAMSFREWEQEHRVNSQTNMFVLSASKTATSGDGGGRPQAPLAAYGTLQKPVRPEEFSKMLEEAEVPSLNIIMR